MRRPVLGVICAVVLAGCANAPGKPTTEMRSLVGKMQRDAWRAGFAQALAAVREEAKGPDCRTTGKGENEVTMCQSRPWTPMCEGTAPPLHDNGSATICDWMNPSAVIPEPPPKYGGDAF